MSMTKPRHMDNNAWHLEWQEYNRLLAALRGIREYLERHPSIIGKVNMDAEDEHLVACSYKFYTSEHEGNILCDEIRHELLKENIHISSIDIRRNLDPSGMCKFTVTGRRMQI
jgi:hypothetical protein